MTLKNLSFVVHNQLKSFKVQTKDGKHLRVFSIFYQHPGMLNEDGWKLFKLPGTKKQILIDVNTLYVLDHNMNEFGYKPNTDIIETCKLTCTFKTQDEVDKHWEDMKEYAVSLKKDQKDFFDKQKVEELAKSTASLHLEDNHLDTDSAPPKKA